MRPDPPSDIFSPVFVVGMPRSGTTLLAAMLDAHPALALSPESEFLTYWTGYLRRRGFERFLRAYLVHPHFLRFRIPPEEFRRRLEASKDRSPRGVFACLLAAYAELHGKRRPGEKTPNHWRHVATLRQWFPDARVIHLVRDPRAVVASLAKTPWAHRHLDWYARQWRDCMRAMRRHEVDPAVRVVRYEDLVVAPEAEARSLCEFLGEEFSDRMLRREGLSHRVHSDDAWVREHHRRSMAPVETSGLDRWRGELDAATLRVVEHRADREEMARRGYVPESVPFSATRAMTFDAGSAARRLAFEASRFLRKVRHKLETAGGAPAGGTSPGEPRA